MEKFVLNVETTNGQDTESESGGVSLFEARKKYELSAFLRWYIERNNCFSGESEKAKIVEK